MSKYRFIYLPLLALLCGICAQGQDVRFLQHNAMPTIVNPAFAGMFDGSIRTSALYRNQWLVARGTAFSTAGMSVDAPLYLDKYGNYVAAGLCYLRDGTSDVVNTQGAFSLSYHKFFGLSQYQKHRRGGDLGVGLQGSFGHAIFDIPDIFYGETFLYYGGYYRPFPVNYFMVGAGICYTRAAGERFVYTVGFAGNRLNQPADAARAQVYEILGIGRSYSGTLTASYQVSPKFMIRPSFFYLYKSDAAALIAGAEVQYLLKNVPQIEHGATSLFAGLWQHPGKMAGFTAGIQVHAFRIGIGFDQSYAHEDRNAGGSGGYELTVKYIAPANLLFSRGRVVPSGLF